MENSEGEDEAGAEAALILGEDQHRAVAEDVGAVALSEEVADFEKCLKASRAVSGEMNRLAKMDVEERRSRILREGRDRGHGVVRLPSIAGAPARAGAFKSA